MSENVQARCQGMLEERRPCSSRSILTHAVGLIRDEANSFFVAGGITSFGRQKSLTYAVAVKTV